MGVGGPLGALGALGALAGAFPGAAAGRGVVGPGGWGPGAGGGRVQGGFVGVSVELSGVSGYLEDPSRFAAYAELVGGLSGCAGAPGPLGCAGPRMRIGGNSADRTAWQPSPDAPLPAGASQGFGPRDAEAAGQFAEAVNGSLVFDLNLAGLGPDYGRQFLEGLRGTSAWARTAAVEVGNEPDLYHGNGYRNATYRYAAYLDEFRAYLEALAPERSTTAADELLPAGGLQVGTFCCRWSSCDFLPPMTSGEYLGALSKRWPVGSVSFHAYSLKQPPNHPIPTLALLMAEDATRGIADFLAPMVAAARAAPGGPIDFWLGEGNTCVKGGAAGVSDAGASALWAVDWLFELARVGVVGANLHGGSSAGSLYTPVAFDESGRPLVMPVYYGMRLFAEATRSSDPRGAELVEKGPSKVACDGTGDPNAPEVKLWAVRRVAESSGSLVTVVAVHKGLQGAATTCAVAGAGLRVGAAGALRLEMADPAARGAAARLTWAGQTWDGSADGRPIGKRRVEPLAPSPDGSFRFTLAPGSAVVVDLPLA